MFLPHTRGCVFTSYDDVLQRLNLSTSAGWPLKEDHANKREYVESKPEELRESVTKFWDSYKSLVTAAVCVWLCTLKDERRLKEKIDLNKIRTFTASPFVFLIVQQIVMRDFLDKIHGSLGKTPVCVGMSKFQGGFHALYMRLARHAHGSCADVGAFDSSVSQDYFARVFYLMWASLRKDHQTQENWNILMNIFRELCWTWVA